MRKIGVCYEIELANVWLDRRLPACLYNLNYHLCLQPGAARIDETYQVREDDPSNVWAFHTTTKRFDALARHCHFKTTPTLSQINALKASATHLLERAHATGDAWMRGTYASTVKACEVLEMLLPEIATKRWPLEGARIYARQY